MSEESEQFEKKRQSQLAELRQRQTKEMQNFDDESVRVGISQMALLSSSQFSSGANADCNNMTDALATSSSSVSLPTSTSL
jgi:hypothetical protein